MTENVGKIEGPRIIVRSWLNRFNNAGERILWKKYFLILTTTSTLQLLLYYFLDKY